MATLKSIDKKLSHLLDLVTKDKPKTNNLEMEVIAELNVLYSCITSRLKNPPPLHIITEYDIMQYYEEELTKIFNTARTKIVNLMKGGEANEKDDSGN